MRHRRLHALDLNIIAEMEPELWSNRRIANVHCVSDAAMVYLEPTRVDLWKRLTQCIVIRGVTGRLNPPALELRIKRNHCGGGN
jgi:hypothetical protein